MELMMPRNLLIDPHMSYRDLKQYAAELGVTVKSTPLSGDINGVYDGSLNMIVIDRTNTFIQKRCTLVHELIHWAYGDVSCDPVFHAREENRTKRETADALIDPLRYAIAESMYEDLYQIARELEVTLQVVEDFQVLTESRTHPIFLSRAIA